MGYGSFGDCFGNKNIAHEGIGLLLSDEVIGAEFLLEVYGDESEGIAEEVNSLLPYCFHFIIR